LGESPQFASSIIGWNIYRKTPKKILYLVVKIMLSYGKKHGFPFSHPLTKGFADSPGFWWIFRWETQPNHRRNKAMVESFLLPRGIILEPK
jgi:hypothetical protein